MDQIAQTASGMASDLYNWAGQTFAQTSQITNQAVGNFFQVSSNMLGLSQNLTNQYNNLFAPENAQLVADANSYASPARMSVDMGMAGATQAQAGSDALANSEEALRSYGIDPSAGRYAALDQASRVQNAANVAGAENQQRVADIATGQQLRQAAVNVGAQLPAAISNVNNTAIQANTGASNAELANANTGANLYGLADKYLGTAMSLKLPFSGSAGSSQSNGSSSGNKGSNGSGGSGAGGGNGGGGNSNPGTSWSGMAPNTAAQGNGGGAGGGSQSGPLITQIPGGTPGPDTGPGSESGPVPETPGDGGEIPWWTDTGGQAGTDASNQWAGSQPDNPGSWDPSQTDTGGIPGDWTDPTPSDPGTNWDGGNTPYDPTGNAPTSSPDDSSLDPFANGDGGSYGGSSDQGYTDPSQQAPSDNSGGGSTDNSAMDYSDFARGGPVPLKQMYGSNHHLYPPDGEDNFARGGHVPMRRLSNHYMAPSYAGGGQVPASASPSHGARVDDVRARGPGNAPMHLNANEFVIPQDVALWKGQEFFQKMINQARMARQGAPAKPTRG